MRRLNVTEGLLFVVLWGGNEASEGGEKGAGRRGVDEEEGAGGNRLERQADPQTEASLPNKQRHHGTNAAQETASALETKLLWHQIKRSAIRRVSTLGSPTDFNDKSMRARQCP